MTNDDQGCVERSLQGDHEAFETLVQRYQRMLYSLAYRMTGSSADAGFSYWLYLPLRGHHPAEEQNELDGPPKSILAGNRLMKTTSHFTRPMELLCAIALTLLLPATARAQSLYNPHWHFVVDPFGYSDWAADWRAGFEGRNYLSGEWAAAIAYAKDGTTNGPTWLNPAFLDPDWSSNSDFGSEPTTNPPGQTNTWGFDIYRSIITNSSLRIGIRSEMIDTTNGIPQGRSPRSAPTGSNVMSDRYVFRQTFSITNISGTTLTSVQFFKFLHALKASSAVYDDRAYPGTLDNHHYVISQKGFSTDFQYGNTPAMHTDVVALHANVPSDAWEVGYYGIDLVDKHATGKPSVGVHWSVETNALSGQDYFAPTNKWVSGAMRQSIGTLAPNASTNLEYLMTVRTDTVSVPLRITHVNTNIVLSWSAAAGSAFHVWQVNSLKTLYWSRVYTPVVVVGENNTLTLPIMPGAYFYRLYF